MRGLLINSYDQSVGPIHLSQEASVYYRQINQALRCSSHIYGTSVDKKTQLIIDENCLLKEGNPAFMFNFFSMPLFGNIILIGHDPRTGDKIDLNDSIHALSIVVAFFSKEKSETARLECLAYAAEVSK